MKTKILFITLIYITISVNIFGQEDNEPKNLSSEVLERAENKLVFGGYGQVDLIKPMKENGSTNASLDVSRLVLSMGYEFNEKTSFFAEIEYEHVKELFVEQAFINYSFNDYFNLRTGLMLVPMGIINEYHEPPSFNGVNRPSVDNIIVPTTWREIGIGLTGRIQDAGIKYQAYLFNGFYGFDGSKGLVNGEKFLRDARQKGAKSVMTSPDLSLRLDYYGISRLKIGLSGYFGKTESALYKSLDMSNSAAVARADSSILGIKMAGLDARYSIGGFSFRGELIFSSLSNTAEYNELTNNNAGNTIIGLYAEAAYNVLHKFKSEHSLTPFFRYENYDTHFKVDENITRNDSYKISEYIFGLGWKPAAGAVFKIDMQLARSEADATTRKTINAGIGLWF